MILAKILLIRGHSMKSRESMEIEIGSNGLRAILEFGPEVNTLGTLSLRFNLIQSDSCW